MFVYQKNDINMKFEKLTNDLLEDKQYSRNEINLFTIDMIARIKKMINSVLPPPELTILETVHSKFAKNYSDLTNKTYTQISGTISKQDAFDDALDFIRTKEGIIKGTFRKESAEYAEFYAQGLTAYNHAKVEGMKPLLENYVLAAKKHQAKLGIDFVNEVTALQIAYETARDEQVNKKGDNSSIQAQVRESRNALTMHLSSCVLMIASKHIKNPAGFLAYFNFGLLEVDNDKTGDDGVVTPPVEKK